MSFFKNERIKERERGFSQIQQIQNNLNDSFSIHYSCESFYNTDGRTPRIASISTLNFGSEQIKSFSIHKQAQIKSYDFKHLTEEQFNECELRMLKSFNSFLKENFDKNYVHWRMNSSDYGFEAINTRYQILSNSSDVIDIKDKYKFDLSQILKLIYTKSYAEHGELGKLFTLKDINKYDSIKIISGKEEAEEFQFKNWNKIQSSTQAKVNIFKKIVDDINTKNLKTNSKWFKTYGISLKGIAEAINNNIYLRILWWIILVIIGAFIKDYVLQE
ncbi:hypothetical protein [uncultured Tenacibaculum sp.]|uniref:hypothetical protein n=1 Tax=uncultured Tenacibaculum sp. TaxID=174713 RepID=UPI002617B66C|nr:hypothetical protein [uncultured Tenacibaculum sp.]